jgi:hypothetical protein
VQRRLPSPTQIAQDMPALDQLFTTVEHYEHPNLINFLSVRFYGVARGVFTIDRHFHG